jgi:predicted GNAT superfamily acetyltransferase
VDAGRHGSEAAWRAAAEAADRAGVRLEPVDTLDAIDEALAIITEVWGEEAAQRHWLRAIQHAGSVFRGARSGSRMVGFVLGFLGCTDGLHIHSHMLAVLPGWQSKGVGYALKLAQRADALSLGFDDVRWTFDPLLARNARFNLGRLGTVAWRWHPEFYGEMPDKLNRGDRSDRFEVRWVLRSERVGRILAGTFEQPRPGPALLDRKGPADAPRPIEATGEGTPGCTVAIPPDHFALRQRDPELGRAWRDASARAFDACFRRGLLATWMTADCRYVFEASP